MKKIDSPLRLVEVRQAQGQMEESTEQRAETDGQGESERGRAPRALSSLDKIAFGLVVLLLLLAPVGAGWFATPTIGNNPPADALSYLQVLSGALIELLAGIALLVAIVREWERPVSIGPVAALPGAGLLLAVWAGLSMLVHTPVSHLALNAYAILLASLVVGGLVSRLGRDRNALVALLLVVAGAGTLASAFGVYEYLDHWRHGDIGHRVFGSFSGPNFLAGYVLLCLPLTLACFVSASQRTSRMLLGFGLLLQTMCLLLTASRAGIGMLFIVLSIWLALLARAGLLRTHARTVGTGLALMLVSGLLASAPLLLRVASARNSPAATSSSNSSSNSSVASSGDSQGHSGKFRQYTWLGTARMVRANPLVGNGIGNYETAYSRYAITAFTAHAHNSFLQWTADTGLPGALLLLVVLASSTAFGAHVLFLRGGSAILPEGTAETRSGEKQAGEKADSHCEIAEGQTPSLPHGFIEPRLLLAGLLASVASSTLHGLFDSDWYIVATAVTFSAVIGLLVALGRDIAPLATQTPRPLSRGMLAGCLLVVVFLFWRGGTSYLSRVALVQALYASFDFREQMTQRDGHATESLQTAIDSYSRASGLDPYNPEPLLTLSSLYQAQGNLNLALTAQEQATRISPTAKPFYQLGQYHRRRAFQSALNNTTNSVSANSGGKATQPLMLADDAPGALSGTDAVPGSLESNELKRAITALERAHDLDPHSLQTLRVLAETQAMLGNTEQSLALYREMEALEETPLGTVRAIPEIIEPDFAFAHARLALYLAGANPAKSTSLEEALEEYRKADTLLKTYWNNRTYELYQVIPVERRRTLALLYATLLQGWQTALKARGGEALRQLPSIQQEQEKFLLDKQADEAKEARAQAEAATASDLNTGSNTDKKP